MRWVAVFIFIVVSLVGIVPANAQQTYESCTGITLAPRATLALTPHNAYYWQYIQSDIVGMVLINGTSQRAIMTELTLMPMWDSVSAYNPTYDKTASLTVCSLAKYEPTTTPIECPNYENLYMDVQGSSIYITNMQQFAVNVDMLVNVNGVFHRYSPGVMNVWAHNSGMYLFIPEETLDNSALLVLCEPPTPTPTPTQTGPTLTLPCGSDGRVVIYHQMTTIELVPVRMNNATQWLYFYPNFAYSNPRIIHGSVPGVNNFYRWYLTMAGTTTAAQNHPAFWWGVVSYTTFDRVLSGSLAANQGFKAGLHVVDAEAQLPTGPVEICIDVIPNVTPTPTQTATATATATAQAPTNTAPPAPTRTATVPPATRTATATRTPTLTPTPYATAQALPCTNHRQWQGTTVPLERGQTIHISYGPTMAGYVTLDVVLNGVPVASLAQGTYIWDQDSGDYTIAGRVPGGAPASPTELWTIHTCPMTATERLPCISAYDTIIAVSPLTTIISFVRGETISIDRDIYVNVNGRAVYVPRGSRIWDYPSGSYHAYSLADGAKLSRCAVDATGTPTAGTPTPIGGSDSGVPVAYSCWQDVDLYASMGGSNATNALRGVNCSLGCPIDVKAENLDAQLCIDYTEITEFRLLSIDMLTPIRILLVAGLVFTIIYMIRRR